MTHARGLPSGHYITSPLKQGIVIVIVIDAYLLIHVFTHAFIIGNLGAHLPRNHNTSHYHLFLCPSPQPMGCDFLHPVSSLEYHHPIPRLPMQEPRLALWFPV